MNNITWFSESVAENDVPLCKQFLQMGGTAGAVTTVRQAVVSGSGLLLIGDSFKGLIFNNKPQYQQLLTALELYVVEPDEAGVLVIRAEPNGYVTAGATWEFETDYHWTKEGTAYHFRAVKPTVQSESNNPFVRKSGAPTVQSQNAHAQRTGRAKEQK